MVRMIERTVKRDMVEERKTKKVGLVLEGGGVRALENRHEMYNRTVERITELEQAGEIFVIRPQRPLNIGRLESDPESIQRVYDAGYADGQACMETLRNWLQKNR